MDRAADGASISGYAIVLLLELSAIGSAARGASEKAGTPRHREPQTLSSCAVADSELSRLLGSKEQKPGGIDIESCEEKNSWSCILECHACLSTKTKLLFLWAATL
ncbi:hypothetical protein BGZ57DRAFT_852468 [Hyaloscypha finlandica]|nr:hypothetical protein BGZ57DRAFT_852468 [Hyaloscypha finlandica]